MLSTDIWFWGFIVNIGWTIINTLLLLVIIVKIASMNGVLSALSKAVMHVALHQRKVNGDGN